MLHNKTYACVIVKHDSDSRKRYDCDSIIYSCLIYNYFIALFLLASNKCSISLCRFSYFVGLITFTEKPFMESFIFCAA